MSLKLYLAVWKICLEIPEEAPEVVHDKPGHQAGHLDKMISWCVGREPVNAEAKHEIKTPLKETSRAAAAYTNIEQLNFIRKYIFWERRISLEVQKMSSSLVGWNKMTKNLFV